MRRSIVMVLLVAMTLAACSSSSKKSSTSPTTAAAGGTATTAPAAAGASGGAPVKIAFLDIETGPNAASNRHDALELGIDAVNANGGVDGHKVQYTSYDTGILPASTVTAIQKAISDHPTVIIGLQVSSGVLAGAPALKASGIPVLQVGNDNSTDFSKLGVANLYRINTTNVINSGVASQFILSKHPKTVGVFDDSNLAGVQQMAQLRANLQKGGVTNIIYREVPQGATDATAAALAMKNADIVTGTGFPVTTALFVKQMWQNGVTAPDVMGSDGLTIVGQKLVPAAAIANDDYFHPCDAAAIGTPQANAYATAFKAKFPSDDILSSSPFFYDAVNFVAAAIQKAGGSLDSSALVNAMNTLSITGVCGPIQSDSNHNLTHSAEIISAANGQLVASYNNLPSS
jgi:branched-chain amino acid transport system substrate-binding protein